MDIVNQLVNGDVLEVMTRAPSDSVHLAITSPPYNVGKAYDAHDDEMDYQDYLNWLNRVWKETKRILVPGGRLCLNVATTGIKEFTPLHHDLTSQLRRLGMRFRTEIIWDKQSMKTRTAWGSFRSPSNPHIIPSWEYVLVFSKERNKLDGKKQDADITSEEFVKFSNGMWHITPETRRDSHPAPFPEELVYRLVKFYSFRGNTVLDMFGGVGTVALVCCKTKRKFVHIDVSEEYCRTAGKRLEACLGVRVAVRHVRRKRRTADPAVRGLRRNDQKTKRRSSKVFLGRRRHRCHADPIVRVRKRPAARRVQQRRTEPFDEVLWARQGRRKHAYTK